MRHAHVSQHRDTAMRSTLIQTAIHDLKTRNVHTCERHALAFCCGEINETASALRHRGLCTHLQRHTPRELVAPARNADNWLTRTGLAVKDSRKSLERHSWNVMMPRSARSAIYGHLCHLNNIQKHLSTDIAGDLHTQSPRLMIWCP